MSNLKKQRVLNLGCGNDTTGTDFVDLYPSRSEVIKCNIETQRLPYPDNTFDSIISYGVIGHVSNIPNYLNECRRTLKKGGSLDILTTNAGFWGVFGKTLHGGYEQVSKMSGRPNDKIYYLFTPYSLTNLLNRYGFKQVVCKYQIKNRGKIKPTHVFFITLLTLVSKRLSPHIRAISIK